MARTFYQNPAINPATMNFNFAHVYSNRQEMENKKRTDGVYPGRYILIEYDKAFEPISINNQGELDFNNSYSYKKVYALEYVVEDETASELNYIPNNVTRVTYNGVRYDISNEADTFLTSVKENQSKVITYSDHIIYDDYDIPVGITKGTIVAVGNLDETVFYFYQAINGISGEPVQFKLLDLELRNGVIYYNGQPFDPNHATEGEIYAYNYFIDKIWADRWGVTIGRGYDSTVWQKTIVNGELTYVQIAELNTVTPTFDLLIDSPKDEGESPYFDEISSNVYYRLHDTANWGMRIKEANPNMATSSDPATYPHDIQENGVDLAIYWNKNGFSDVNIYKDNIHDNNIQIANTGISGRSYIDTNGPAPDIKEISIMLPGLGNTISDVWDIVYGNQTTNINKWIINGNDIDEYENTREKDIAWYNASDPEEDKNQGLRLVNNKYPIEEDGQYHPIYDTNALTSLAGCINSVHDLMGMIIYDGSTNGNPIDIDDEQQLEEASTDYIYYLGDNDYYRKGVKTEYDTEYDPDNLYEEISVIAYDSNAKYFYKDLINYKRLLVNNDEKPDNSIPYFQFTNESTDMVAVNNLINWQNNHYFYVTEIPGGSIMYNLENNGLDKSKMYYDVSFYRGEQRVFYDKNRYYVCANENLPIDEDGNRVHPTEDEPVEGTRYYFEYKYRKRNPQTGTYELITAYQGIDAENLTVFQPSTYFLMQGNDFILLTEPIFYSDTPVSGEAINLNVTVSRLESITGPLHFYSANDYYYKVYPDSGRDDIYHYYKDPSPTLTEGRQYYDLRHEPVKIDKFYEENLFYYDDGEHYVIDSSENYTPNRTYYKKLSLYVVEDLTNQYRIGSEWNQSLGVDKDEIGTYDYTKTPPKLIAGTQIGTKVEKPAWYPMPEFARKLNTIHGMLLKINALLNTDDVKTRDTDTVQGCINTLKDLIDLFGDIFPNTILMANGAGKVVTGSLSGDNWTSLSAAAGPQLQVSHLGQTSTKTTPTVNLNITGGNTITLLDITTDGKGHVTAESRTTTTLPNSYGSISGDSGSVSATDSTDVLTIAGDNSLISTNAANSTLTITHETHTVTPDNTPTSSLSSTSTIPSIVVHQYGYDGAGHITSETNTTVSGVASYGIVTGDTGAGANATASLDTLSIIGDNTWIETSAANKNVTISHKVPTVVYPEQGSDLTPVFGGSFSITDWHYDFAGHKDGSSTHTVTIPQGSLVDDNTEYGTSANVLTGINFIASSGRIGYTHQNASTLLLTGYNSAHNIVSANGSIGDAFASIEGKFNTLENSISGNANDIDALETAVNTINNTTIPNIINTTIPNTVNGAVRDLVNGASDAFNTLKEIEDWISDGQTGVSALVTRVGTLESDLSDTNDSTVNGSLAYRVSALEADIGNLSGGGSGSVSSQISSAISTYDSEKNFGDVITHDVSEFESAGAASAVQGNTQSTVEDIEDALDDYIAKTDTFTYDNSDPLDPVEMTVAQLVAYVKTLEDRIVILEGGGNEPEPQTPVTPDVVIEFTQGVGSTTADFTDVLTNIGGDNDLTYSVVVDNVELDLDETTPVEIQQDNGNDIIVINLDDTTYEKVVWANDGINDTFTLISF